MFTILACLAVILIILVASEYGWQHKLLRNERARKFVHILVGSFVAFWPWLMSWRDIQLLSVALLVAVLVCKHYRIFHALLSVRRRTYGGEMFAIAIGLSATITTNKSFFMIGILNMALADGVAALVGRAANRKWRYKIFGQSKTVMGSMAFWIVSMWIIGFGLLLNQTPYTHYFMALLVIPPLATIIENVFPFGLDNIALPVSVIGLLIWLQ